jgi:hypothetical protein
MATERFIRGKHDEGKHVGRYHNVRAEQSAQFQLDDFDFYETLQEMRQDLLDDEPFLNSSQRELLESLNNQIDELKRGGD